MTEPKEYEDYIDFITIIDALEEQGHFYLIKKITHMWDVADKLVREGIIKVVKEDEFYTWYELKK